MHVITRSGSPLDGGSGPVRLAVLYRWTHQAALPYPARPAAPSEAGAPLDDGLFMSSSARCGDMKPSEYPLAEPYRLKIIQATDTTRIDDYAKDMPVEKFKKEELRLLNGLYPKGEPKPGDSIKVVQ